MEQILNGIKILDFTQMKTGPMGTQILGDFGADIIKVERGETGDWERQFPAFGKYTDTGASSFFLALNRNKRSLSLDLKAVESKEIIYRLVKEVDVVVQNFRPGVMDRLGFGYSDLKKIKPDIIYCSNSGYGLTGPYTSRPGQDLLAQAVSGLIQMNGTEKEPTPVATSVADGVTAIYLALAVLGALYHKKCTGEGQEVAVDLLSSLVAFQQEEVSAYLNIKPTPSFQRSKNGIAAPWNGAPYGIYKTSDNKFIAIAMNPLDKLGELIGELKICKYTTIDEAFNNRDLIREMIQTKIADQPLAYWIHHLLEADIWCAQVNDFSEMIADPQVQHNQLIQKLTHPKWGDIDIVATPIRYSKTPPKYKLAPPVVGEHSSDVLAEVGYSEKEISDFVQRGIITTTDVEH